MGKVSLLANISWKQVENNGKKTMASGTVYMSTCCHLITVVEFYLVPFASLQSILTGFENF